MGKHQYSKTVTTHLRTLAGVAHDWSQEDGVITKGEALAQLIWRAALGWTEETVDDEGRTKKEYHKPASWAQQFLIERMDGKVPQSKEEDDAVKRKAKDEVRELAKSRLNDIAKSASKTSDGGLKTKGPPKRKKKSGDG